ncbi:Zn(II)2Cys6 transcription factor [Aspergillus oryzae 3.042]|uniref:Zn(II)2Cys6 transcription factor n=1 Tax=Aspergillus oryzae (strain 3.042) TaxID=1160506 RepID=I8I8M4_ASPO3|nr:Zn(II)2Cys6 transcription factor [Aspergillus oryzae 3.042]|eukprot:EIT73416.1 Zn(II)2Cys6 transcription factor [Aspergillus oryzae 3.042]
MTFSSSFLFTISACLACRQRKAKCELGTGPDGLALGPPCAKCRREQRECVFSEKKAWERQKKRGELTRQSEEGTPLPARARPRLSSNPGISRDESHHVLSHGPSPLSYAEQNQDNGDSTLQSSPTEGSQRRRQSTSTLANSMMRTVVSSGNDALNILFEAAAAHSKEHGNGLSESSTPSRNARSSTGRSNNYESSLNQSIVPPEVLAKAAQPVEVSQASKEVLSVWGACRFVRMGWFTAREAVTFIDLFV